MITQLIFLLHYIAFNILFVSFTIIVVTLTVDLTFTLFI